MSNTMQTASLADLAEQLTSDMNAAWHRGECLLAENYLTQHPDLLTSPDAAARLVYEEVCLRQEHGEEVTTEELSRRFPRWTKELGVMLECHQLLTTFLAQPQFPEAGEWLGDFRLLSELGRGRESRVFLATQPTLADRPVVLKVTPCRDHESLMLARLQHTHIIPLHGVYDFPDQNLRALCQPYFGGATLEQLCGVMRSTPLARRSGSSLIEALELACASAPVKGEVRRGPREVLAKATFVEAICWIGTCLADALHYAHERGLVHLDLKPSNVLIASDGQPLLLDFHLALHPLAPGESVPAWFGGTPEFMSPEQRTTCAALSRGDPIPESVDARSDIYSFGRLLYVLLSCNDKLAHPYPPLHRQNPQVTVGLSDIVSKCLALRKEDRYASAAALASDLRRHLAHQPLKGVTNRSLSERWAKWRYRRPNVWLWTLLLLALMTAGAAVWWGIIAQRQTTLPLPATQVPREATAELQAFHKHYDQGMTLLQAGDLAQAAEALNVAIDLRPQDFDAHFQLGLCCYRRGQFDAAVHSFGVAIALAPRRAEAYYNRALAYTALGKRSQAMHDYDRALTLSPRLGEAWLNRAILHFQCGNTPQTKADLLQALQHGADPALVHYNLALCHRALRDDTTAQSHLIQALAHNPKLGEARALLDQLRKPRN